MTSADTPYTSNVPMIGSRCINIRSLHDLAALVQDRWVEAGYGSQLCFIWEGNSYGKRSAFTKDDVIASLITVLQCSLNAVFAYAAWCSKGVQTMGVKPCLGDWRDVLGCMACSTITCPCLCALCAGHERVMTYRQVLSEVCRLVSRQYSSQYLNTHPIVDFQCNKTAAMSDGSPSPLAAVLLSSTLATS